MTSRLEQGCLLESLKGVVKVVGIARMESEVPDKCFALEVKEYLSLLVGRFGVLAHNSDSDGYNADLWDIRFARKVEGPHEVFQNGQWAEHSLEELIQKTVELGRLPDGLRLEAAEIQAIGGRTWVDAIDNRALYMLQEAERRSLRTGSGCVDFDMFNDIFYEEAQVACNKQLDLARNKQPLNSLPIKRNWADVKDCP